MHPDDDTPPPRPRWLGWALIAFGLLITLGMLNLGVRMVFTAKPPQAEAAGGSRTGGRSTAATGLRKPYSPYSSCSRGFRGCCSAPSHLAGRASLGGSE